MDRIARMIGATLVTVVAVVTVMACGAGVVAYVIYWLSVLV